MMSGLTSSRKTNSLSFPMEAVFDEVVSTSVCTSKYSEKDAITCLNELGPHIKLEYNFHQTQDGFFCRLMVIKDREVFDCYGIGKKKQEAKLMAAGSSLGLMKLLFPMVPLAMYNRAPKLDAVYIPVSNFNLRSIYAAFYFKEIRSGNIYVYVNREQKNYVVMNNPSSRTEFVFNPECPLELLNDPIRFTDWSQGPICVAQENYISRRLELL